jgi:hypothetical protein
MAIEMRCEPARSAMPQGALARQGRQPRWVALARRGVAAVAGVIASFALLGAMTIGNQLFASSDTLRGALVVGPAVLDNLLLAYLVPVIVLVAGAMWLPGFGR